MPVSKRKQSKPKPQNKAVPKHVKEASAQLHKMEATIKNLLTPFADRLHLFVHPEQQVKKKKKK